MTSPQSGPWGQTSQSQAPYAYGQQMHSAERSCTARSALSGAVALAAGAGVGAALMYLLDPEAGERRRHRLAEQASIAAENAGATLGSAWQHVSDKASHAAQRLHEVREDAGDYASDAGSSMSDWVSSSWKKARSAMPSRRAMRQSIRPQRWIGHEESFMERHTPSAGAAIGAGTLALVAVGAMFFLDPQAGRRRRALLRDKVVHAGHETSDFLRKTGRHLRNRGKGIAHETRQKFTGRNPASDRQLAERVRSHIGHLGLRGNVDVNCLDGCVQLYGIVVTDDVDRLVSTVQTVPGVQNIINSMEVRDVYESPNAPMM